MVSEWMPNGNVRQYVQNHPEADRLQLVCPPAPLGRTAFILMSRQLLDICHGLQFLHSHDVIHGDLKGVRVSNVSQLMCPVQVLIILCSARTIFLSALRVPLVWETSVFRLSLVLAARRLPRLGPMARSGGWHQNSSFLFFL